MKKDMWLILIVMFASIFIVSKWESVPFLKNTVDLILNPTFGALIGWNFWIGFIVIVGLTSLVLTLSQKYLSDQMQLKELRKEQKYLQDEMKKFKDHPEKLLELQKKQLEFFPKTFELTMKPLIYTSIPIIILFTWFGKHLSIVLGNWWILYYIIGSLVFSSIFRKVFDVV